MKRGFLLKAEAKKASANRRDARKETEHLAASSTSALELRPVPQIIQGFEADNQGKFFGKAPYGNLTEEEKALPSDYKKSSQLVYKATDFSDGARAITTIPQPVPDDESQCQWIVNGSTKAKVLNAKGYPARIPKPTHPDMYQVRSTPEMGIGLFAKRNIKRGDLFLAERPLLVAPRAITRPWSESAIPKHYTPQQTKQIMMLEFERLLEFAIGRLPSESQADFRDLHNAHTADGSGPLLGVMRSNAYSTGILYDGSDKKSDLARYGAVCKIGSRINHSCVPNVRYSFKISSFSMQFYALRDVKAGEQLFYSYCSAESTRAQRQAELAPYGFVCKCPSCDNATPETDKLRTTFGPKIQLLSKMVLGDPTQINQAVLEDVLGLEKDMIREGLDTNHDLVGLQGVITLVYRRLGRMRESDRYHVLMKVLQKCFKDDE